mgnify:CR=1 FL=1
MPKNLAVIDTIPKNEPVTDVLPKNLKLSGELTLSYTVVINAGQYIGLPFLLTYRDTGTVTQFSESGLDH